jgi:hypothetical protein
MKNYKILIIIVSITIILGCAFFKSKKEGLTNNSNIVLIGDSVLNNSKFVSPNKSVADILKTKTPNVYNYAKDGATIQDCYAQLDEIPIDLNKAETYIFISAGGNNILNKNGQLTSEELEAMFNKYMEFVSAVRTKFGSAKINIMNLYLPANPRYQSYKDSVEEWNKLIEDNSSKIGEMYNIVDLFGMLYNLNDFIYDIEPSDIGSEKIANIIYFQN